MSTRNEIIERCRASISRRYERPSLHDLRPTRYDDILLTFVAQAEAAGCHVEIAKSPEEIDGIIAKVYPDAKVIASNLSEVKCATLNPDTVKDAQALNGTDVGVIRAMLGVAENGSVWIPQKMSERDVCFISENIVAVMPKKEIVNNMHEAYALITSPKFGYDDFQSYGYGVFMAGPSKTADIAQVLVRGAQAARSMTLILMEEQIR